MEELQVKPLKVLLFGHSYISRIQTYNIRNSKVNFNIIPSSCEITYLSVPGLKIDNSSTYINRISELSPDLVYLHIGENDIKDKQPQYIADTISSLCKSILSVLPSHGEIILSQLLPFPVLFPLYKQNIFTINSTLKYVLTDTNRITFWTHRGGFWKPPTQLLTGTVRKQLFHHDGVHLSMQGCQTYFVSIRTIIIKKLSQLALHHTLPELGVPIHFDL